YWSERNATVPSSAIDGSQLSLNPARRFGKSDVGAMVETMSMLPVCRFIRNTWGSPLPLGGVAEKSPAESHATHWPLGLIVGCWDGSDDWPTPGFSDSRFVRLFNRSRMKMSITPLVSP